MPEKWTGDLVAKMHMNRIYGNDVAKHCGITRAYFSMIINGKRVPNGWQQRLETAVDEIIAERATA